MIVCALNHGARNGSATAKIKLERFKLQVMLLGGIEKVEDERSCTH